MNKLFTLFLLTIALPIYGQSMFEWETLPNAPVVQRFNDVHIINPNSVWAVNGDGEGYHSTNGGNIWIKKIDKASAHFRSVGFVNSETGFIGNVGPGEFGATDTIILYKTTNGGATWINGDNYSGPKPTGLCGMYVLDDSTVFSVGRVRGPSYFVKTTNGGESWISKDMNSYAAGLIDVHFFNKDSGFVVGLTSITHSQSRGIILFTSDGGESWDTSYISQRTSEWAWKMSFPSRQTGYIALQRNYDGPVNIIKTTNGGETWFEKQAFDFHYFVQGIGFVNDTLGWIGGNSTYNSYQTTDGGETWSNANFGTRVNRVKFYGDTLGYAVGKTIYKYTAEPVLSVEEYQNISGYNLLQNYPNPFNPVTKIYFTIPQNEFVQLKVYDLLGKEITSLINEEKSAGNYEAVFDASKYSSGTYYYELKAGEFVQRKKMIFLK